MKTSDFNYDLPSDLVADYPLAEKDKCNLEVISRSDIKIKHDRFCNILNYLNAGDVLVLNNTKVIPARIYGTAKNRKTIEILLLEKIDSNNWSCLMKNPKDGLELILKNELKAIIKKNKTGNIIISFNREIEKYLDEYGCAPLPPYIERKPEESDKVNYQTVYAKQNGSVAAPTAGLHFTKELLQNITDMGVLIEHLTLHVGYGTFKPVKSEDLENHRMHSEYFELRKNTCEVINNAKLRGNKIIAVGTTSLRTLESCTSPEGILIPRKGKTDLFIYPGYKFKIVDSLVTNFHMPRSTLFMLACAFAGKELIFKAYEQAKNRGYRFLSYGDAMIII